MQSKRPSNCKTTAINKQIHENKIQLYLPTYHNIKKKKKKKQLTHLTISLGFTDIGAEASSRVVKRVHEKQRRCPCRTTCRERLGLR